MIKDLLVKVLPGSMRVVPTHVKKVSSGLARMPIRLTTLADVYYHGNIIATYKLIAWGGLAKTIANVMEHKNYMLINCNLMSYRSNIYYNNGNQILDPNTNKPITVLRTILVITKFTTEFKCRRCGRKLTNGKSIIRGYGLTCHKRR